MLCECGVYSSSIEVSTRFFKFWTAGCVFLFSHPFIVPHLVFYLSKPCPTMSDRNENFQKAVSRFRASLTPQQQRDFQVCSIQDVTKAIQEIDSHWSSKRKQRNMNRISKFIEAMSQLSEVMDRFLNVNAAVAFVWAPIKFILLVSTDSTSQSPK